MSVPRARVPGGQPAAGARLRISRRSCGSASGGWVCSDLSTQTPTLPFSIQGGRRALPVSSLLPRTPTQHAALPNPSDNPPWASSCSTLYPPNHNPVWHDSLPEHNFGDPGPQGVPEPWSSPAAAPLRLTKPQVWARGAAPTPPFRSVQRLNPTSLGGPPEFPQSFFFFFCLEAIFFSLPFSLFSLFPSSRLRARGIARSPRGPRVSVPRVLISPASLAL